MSIYFDYNQAEKDAQEIIKFFATDSINAVLRVDANKGTRDPVTGEYTGGSPAIDYDNLIGVKLGLKKGEADGTLIKENDIKYVLSTENLTVVPSTDNKLIIESETWNIGYIKVLKPTTIAIAYFLYCRK
jgi:hypothetical protein